MLCITCCQTCFCVLLWGHYRCALLICDLKKNFRHQNLVLTVWSGWQVWIKSTALICCRNGLKVCARKCLCAGKMNSLRPAWCCWNATYCFYWPLDDHNTEADFGWTALLPPLLWSGDYWRMQWCWLLTNVQSSFLHRFLSILCTCSFLETVLIEGAESKLDNL